MQAILMTAPGTPEVLQSGEVAQPRLEQGSRRGKLVLAITE